MRLIKRVIDYDAIEGASTIDDQIDKIITMTDDSMANTFSQAQADLEELLDDKIINQSVIDTFYDHYRKARVSDFYT